ncbi:serine hydrolase domain-containing protein [Streptomyces phyllanthi]|uniref:Beta-lactamase family protein n=1 Tax=Streptomyces phyllanthi TaxID=1803180 RepID=A0A5N8W9U0_9ACTN|nr:serine hydrolase domain-containing protein [Streptomyces phyllanthi]MPY44263.1 beta-lactamase family protein [Streptomyces phyllanthi]
MRITRLIGTVLGTTLLMTTALPVAAADPGPAGLGPARLGPAGPGPAASAERSLDRATLRTTLRAVHEAGMYGAYSSVREGADRWTGAAGLADVDTKRPVTPGMRHRVGSISKTFTSVAVLQQVERGRIRLDAPVADYLPGLVPGERGRAVTVRMLLNHTSGISDYVLGAFPSLAHDSAASLDEERFRSIAPEELVRLGLKEPATGRPGEQPGSYSNTNYVIAGLILEKVTGQDAGTYITRNVIDRAGLRHTTYPRTPYIKGPHSRMYESFYGLIDPPRDYSVYDMSWASTAGSIVSTTDDLNRFYRALLGGRLIGAAALDEMLTTVTLAFGEARMDYGLGIYPLDLPGCGRFWGHDGAVFGAGTIALSSRDGRRQFAMGWNLMKYQRVNEDGTWEPSPIDDALNTHLFQALCPEPEAPAQPEPAEPESRTAVPEAGRRVPGGLPGVEIAPGTWATRR